MKKMLQSAAVVTGVLSVGLGVAGTAQAEPDIIGIADQLCPFRGVINAMGGDDECDPNDGWNNNYNNNNGDNSLFHDNGMPCDSVAFPNPACNPTINVNVNHSGQR